MESNEKSPNKVTQNISTDRLNKIRECIPIVYTNAIGMHSPEKFLAAMLVSMYFEELPNMSVDDYISGFIGDIATTTLNLSSSTESLQGVLSTIEMLKSNKQMLLDLDAGDLCEPLKKYNRDDMFLGVVLFRILTDYRTAFFTSICMVASYLIIDQKKLNLLLLLEELRKGFDDPLLARFFYYQNYITDERLSIH